MKISEALQIAQVKLEKSEIATARLDAELLLAFVMKKEKEYLITHSDDHLTAIREKRFFDLVNKRRRRTPLAYITNNKEFYGRTFTVNEKVLIPRPDTELLVELVLKLSKKKKIEKIADIGTGSGAIGITLALELPESKVIASDVSASALQIAKKNSKLLGAKNIQLIRRNLLEKFPEKVDVIVANLPYLTNDEMRKLQPEVAHEPIVALKAGRTGLYYYRELIETCHRYLLPHGRVYLEASDHQMPELIEIVMDRYPQAKTKIYKDLSKKDRVLEIRI